MFLSLYMGCGMLKKDWSHGQVMWLSGTTWGLTPSQPEKCVMKINDPNPRLTTFLGLTATWCACLRATPCYRAVTCGSVPSWCVLTFIFSCLRWCWSEPANPDWNCQRLTVSVRSHVWIVTDPEMRCVLKGGLQFWPGSQLWKVHLLVFWAMPWQQP